MGSRLTLAAAAALLLLAISAAPLFPALYLAFAAACHQAPARCFEWLGHPLPVCARCLALYTGALAAAVWPVRTPKAWLWVFAAANGLDWLFGVLGNGPRFVLAFPLAWIGASHLVALATHEHGAGH